MQRMGGGSRKTKGGGNDPRCGCDMRVGWPSSLQAQSGGGCPCSGSGPLLRSQAGGGCASCMAAPGALPMQGGGKRKTRKGRKGRKGGGLLFANGGGQCCPRQVLRFGGTQTGGACGDFPCPFTGTGYCPFYAKGGSAADRDYTNIIEDAIRALSQFLSDYRPLNQGEVVSPSQLEQMKKEADLVTETFFNKVNDIVVPLSQELQGRREKVFNLNNEMGHRIAEYTAAAAPAPAHEGGKYKPTRRNRVALRKWRKGQSIGFTMTSSLKAKGLIPRTSRKNRGKKIVSAKYK